MENNSQQLFFLPVHRYISSLLPCSRFISHSDREANFQCSVLSFGRTYVYIVILVIICTSALLDVKQKH